MDIILSVNKIFRAVRTKCTTHEYKVIRRKDDETVGFIREITIRHRKSWRFDPLLTMLKANELMELSLLVIKIKETILKNVLGDEYEGE